MPFDAAQQAQHIHGRCHALLRRGQHHQSRGPSCVPSSSRFAHDTGGGTSEIPENRETAGMNGRRLTPAESSRRKPRKARFPPLIGILLGGMRIRRSLFCPVRLSEGLCTTTCTVPPNWRLQRTACRHLLLLYIAVSLPACGS